MTIFLRRAARIVLLALASACVTPAAHSDEPASYVGGQICAGCHAAETERWKGSHHALAMQKVSAATVLGDFAYARVEHFGVVTTFSRSGDKFMVRTDGSDGALHDYEIAYTFGVYPLQQYLIAMAGGRSALVPPLPGSKIGGGGPAALDRARPDLELHVRRLSLDQSAEELRPRRRHLCNHLDRPRRGLRGVPRSRLSPRRLGQGAGRRRLLPVGYQRVEDGPDQLAEADRQRPLGDEPGDRHRPAHRKARLDRNRDLCGLPLSPQGDREGPGARRILPRRLSP